MKAKRLLALLLAMYCATMVGCKKDNENGNNNGNYPQAPKIVSTNEIIRYFNGYQEHDIHDYLVVVEALFDDDRMMYFAITSPTTAVVVDRRFYYEPDNEGDYNEGYEYRGDVIIPSRFEHLGQTYSVTETWSFGGSKLLTSVVFPNTITKVGGCEGCSNLASVSLENSVVEIEGIAFKNCRKLASIQLPERLLEIGRSAFRGTGLTSIIIPKSVTEIEDGAFYRCSNLTSVTIPTSVTRIGVCAFWGCSELTSVSIPDSVLEIGDRAFAGCTGLTSVIIPNSVTSIGLGAFHGCSELKSVSCWAVRPPEVVLADCPDIPGYWSYYQYLELYGPFSGGDLGLFSTPDIIKVPIQSVDAYKNARGWSQYADIIVGF